METLIQLYRDTCDAFWSEKYWLTSNVTWADFENNQPSTSERLMGQLFWNLHSRPRNEQFQVTDALPGIKDVLHPECWELLWGIPIAIFLILLRDFTDRWFLYPLARYCGLKPSYRTKRPEQCKLLTKYFKSNRRPNLQQVKDLTVELNCVHWSVKKVDNWFRMKRNEQKSTKIKKFAENGWRCLAYTSLCIYGLYSMHDEPFFYDWKLSRDMTTWPHHDVKPEFLIYYVSELGLYLSLCASLFTDNRRSDFREQCIHHLATIALIFVSWSVNYLRLGMLILILHDSSDIFLEAAKMAKYVGKELLLNVLFAIFLVVWTSTRLVLYPGYIVIPSWVDYFYWLEILEGGHNYPLFIGAWLLTLLMVLNFFWSFLIFKIVLGAIQNKVEDNRSGSDSESTPCEIMNGKQKSN